MSMSYMKTAFESSIWSGKFTAAASMSRHSSQLGGIKFIGGFVYCLYKGIC